MFDALYDTVVRQVSYIVKSSTLCHSMISLHALIKDSINVLIGVSSATFCRDKVNKLMHSVLVVNLVSIRKLENPSKESFFGKQREQNDTST